MTEQTTYKFKWPNVDLSDYLGDRRWVANQKRADARLLLREAEVIDTECRELEQVLVKTTNGQCKQKITPQEFSPTTDVNYITGDEHD